jgi:protein SCO1/2
VSTRTAASALLVAWIASGGPLARAEERLPRKLEGVTVEEKLGVHLDRELRFRDQSGRERALGSFLEDGKPVLLTLNYYRCKMLCSLQLNALTAGLRGLSWTAGDRFRVVTVSIDHRESPKLAAEKRAAHLRVLGRGESVDWSFLVGDERTVRRLAESVGFGYRYDKDTDQFAHPAAIMFLSPAGKVSRYLYGIEYAPRDLKFALIEAAEGRVGSVADRLILSCFHYDSSSGRYGPFAFGIMRLGGVLTLVLLGGFLALHWRREVRRRRAVLVAEQPRPTRS